MWHRTCYHPPCMALPFLNSQSKRLDQVMGIDLGARETKAVHVQRKNDRIVLLGYTLQPAPPRDKAWQTETLAEHLKGVIRALGDRTRQAALAVGVPEAFLRSAELAPMPLSDMRQMMRLNSKTYLQQDYPDHVFDCALILSRAPAGHPANGKSAPPPAPSGTPKQKILVGGTKRQTLDDLKTACRVAGVVVHQVSPGVLGPVNAFETAEPDVFAKEVVALVDVGLKNSTVTILRHGEMMLNRVVAVGGEQVTAGLAESLGIDPAEAEGLKVGMAEEVRQNLEVAMTPLGRELRASIDFFEHQQDVAVSQVFVSGGAARGPLFVTVLQNELMVPCKAWNPCQRLQMSLPVEQRARLEEVAPQLAVALGTAVSVF
jgi:type IV pilus assembly protein PilM